MVYDDLLSFMYVILQMVMSASFLFQTKFGLLRDLHENALMKLITEVEHLLKISLCSSLWCPSTIIEGNRI